MKDANKKNSLRLIIIFFVTAILTMLLLLAGSLLTRQNNKQEDTNSSSNTEEVVKNDDKTVSMEYSDRVVIDQEQKTITLYFKNPAKSVKDTELEIVAIINDENVVFGKTERLAPGEEIQSIEYEFNQNVEPGEYDGKFILHFLNDSNEEEIINSEVITKVTIK